MALKPLKYSLKHVAMALLLHSAAAGVGTALPPYKHRRGFFARGGGFAIGNTGPSEEIEALAGESFDWLANLGAPAALVAGAVIATMIDQADFLKTRVGMSAIEENSDVRGVSRVVAALVERGVCLFV